MTLETIKAKKGLFAYVKEMKKENKRKGKDNYSIPSLLDAYKLFYTDQHEWQITCGR